MPQEVIRFCDRVGRVMNYGDGLYGGMFIGGMYAAAFVESDPRRVVEAGLACLPPQSGYARILRDLLSWSAEQPEDWRAVWRRIQEKWDRHDVCPDGFLRPFNIDAKLNGAYVAFGLLFGGGDFERTMEISTRCGQDSDCNPSSAAGVLGVMLGFERIPAKFKAALPELANRKFDYTDYSFNDIVRSTESRALKLIAANGGKVTEREVTLRRQEPQPPPLEQWNPGIPDRRIGVGDAAWQWKGEWKEDRGHRVAATAGPQATFSFEGVAIAVLGRLNQVGGRAEVYLDGRKQELPLDAYVVPNTHDNVLWQTYGLKPGRHTLRIVPTGGADARSGGTEIAIREALVYRQP